MTGALDAGTVAAILVMACVTIFNRTMGFMVMRLVPLTPRVRRILDGLPGALLIAIVVPAAVHGGLTMGAGLAAAFAAALLVRNDFVAVVAAAGVAAGLRAFGF